MKIFTIEEANGLLPSVRGIVSRIRTTHRGVSKYRNEVKKAADAASHGGGIVDGPRYAILVTSLNAALSELEALGVQLKDYDRGLVDFPSLRDGRVVLLCWQLGEGDELEWWHDVDAGFAGRTRL
ncbi:MAG TPA: DUF2203 domain-containing protein [Pyrinomonadaceae bacterium]|nr:DUF2203 domain-containing protein [Pyrinomonadaceae bacterium]